MSASGQDDRARWVNLPPGAGLESEAGALLRRAAEGSPAPAESLTRVHERLFARARTVRVRAHRRSLRWAVVCLVLLGSGGVVFARREIGGGLARLWQNVREAVSGMAPEGSRGDSRSKATPAGAAATETERAAAATETERTAAATETERAAAATGSSRPALPPPATSPPTPSRPDLQPVTSPRRLSSPAVSPRSALPLASSPARLRQPAVSPPPGSPAPGSLRRIVSPAPAVPSQPSATAPARAAAPLPRRIAAAPPPHPLAVDPAPPSSAPGPLAGEAQLLGEAIAQLRQHGNPRVSLAALERYHSRYPAGALRQDAALVQLDALIALGRPAQALATLDSLPPETVAPNPELRLIRAELRAARSCAAALPDFDWILAHPLPAPLAERALYGRAGCRLRLGDHTGAQDDLRAYRTRFPGGRFIQEVERHLNAHQGSAPTP